MSRLHLLCLLLSLFVLNLPTHGTILTVSNNPLIPAQYTTFDAAYLASRAGDTLLFSVSQDIYSGSQAITKRLVLMGPGLDPNPPIIGQFNQRLKATVSVSLDSNSFGSASGTQIIGLYLWDRAYFRGSLRNITITDSDVSVLDMRFGACRNFLIKNCRFNQAQFSGGSYSSNVIITNNIISQGIYGARSRDLISNNLFLSGSPFSDVSTCTFINNIFIGGSLTSATNCTFNNNIYFGTSTNPLPFGSNVGANNINQDPQFVGALSTTTNFDVNSDYRLQNNSPGRNAGTDGTNIGPTGGLYPWYHQLSNDGQLPYVEMVNILNPSVAPGGTLQVRVKAQKGR